MKRVAIPVAEDQLSEHFGQCNYYKIYNVDNGVIKSDSTEEPAVQDFAELPLWAARQGITDVIVHKIDKKIITLFAGKKIDLFVGVAIDSPATLIEDYLNGNLKSNEQIIKAITE